VIVQVSKRRPFNKATVYEVNEDGTIKPREKTLVVEFSREAFSVADAGSVWSIKGKCKNISFAINGCVVSEDLIKAVEARLQRPSGELLARWITRNIKGVGDVKARRLVRAIDDLDAVVRGNDLEVISNVAGFSNELASNLIKGWLPPKYYEVITWLQSAGVEMAIADRITKIYGDEALERITGDPFILTSFGIGFDRINTIIKELSLSIADEAFLAAIAERVATDYGHATGSTAISEEMLISGSTTHCKALGLQPKNVVKSAIGRGVLVPAGRDFQLIGSAIQEATVGEFLRSASARDPGAGSLLAGWEKDLTQNAIRASIAQFERTLPFEMTNEQKDAVIGVISSPAAAISGGAGTGKTTIILAVLAAYRILNQGLPIYQVALSGRAAQRMAEATGREATTIAKFLANHAGSDKPSLPEHLLLVIDEASMVDLLSMYKLCRTLPKATRIIFVGDVAQLPPVGAGLVFHALENSSVPSFHLSQVKRQSAQSGIHHLATNIRLAKSESAFLLDPPDDICVIRETTEQALIDTFNACGGAEHSIFLTPTRNGKLGVDAVNKLIQSSFDNLELPEIRYDDDVHGLTKWLTRARRPIRLHDQVIVTKNDYDEDIRNGDLGRIVKVFDRPDNGVYGVIEIDGILKNINNAVLEKLELGYAITIHKSQGSQWPTCVLLLDQIATKMLDQTLLYTAVTRPSESLVIMGDIALIESAVKKGSSAQHRNVNILERL